MENIVLFIITMIALISIIYIIYRANKEGNSRYEKISYFILALTEIIILTIYFLDRYNIPSELGMNDNVNTQNWLVFLGTYVTGMLGAGISAAVSIFVMRHQIKKNNEDNIKRDKENLRVQNMPILKYLIDTENKSKGTLEGLIITNADNGNAYNLNISIKNIGLNNIKNIKVDFKSSIIGHSIYRILGNQSIEVLEKGEEIELKKFFSLKPSNEPYDIDLVIYYEDVLSNWYRQILNIHYTATDVSKDGYISTVRYEVNKEEIIEEKEIESKVL